MKNISTILVLVSLINAEESSKYSLKAIYDDYSLSLADCAAAWTAKELVVSVRGDKNAEKRARKKATEFIEVSIAVARAQSKRDYSSAKSFVLERYRLKISELSDLTRRSGFVEAINSSVADGAFWRCEEDLEYALERM